MNSFIYSLEKAGSRYSVAQSYNFWMASYVVPKVLVELFVTFWNCDILSDTCTGTLQMEGGIRYIINCNARNESLAGAIDTSSAKHM